MIGPTSTRTNLLKVIPRNTVMSVSELDFGLNNLDYDQHNTMFCPFPRIET